MTKSARRARKKRMAQEALQGKEGPRCGEPMDPLDLSGPETDREEEDDPEILFPARAREPEKLVTPPRRAQQRDGDNQQENSSVDRDLTHTGLHSLHLNPTPSSCIKPSRILQSILFNHIRVHVQKHVCQPRIRIL